MHQILSMIFFLTAFVAGASDFGKVVFSELMVDPEPVVGLPAVEFIEICNRSEQAVSLEGWSLQYGEKSFPLPTVTLGAGQYALLCAKNAAASFSTEILVYELSAFPALLNTGKLMALISDKMELVCCLEYASNWYGSGFKSNGGWSLECIDLSNFSELSSNWTASTDPSGGTPGRPNTVESKNPDETAPICTHLYVLSPNTLELCFSKFMQAETLSEPLIYTVFPEKTLVVSAKPSYPGAHSVLLVLSDTLVSEEVYALTFVGASDLSGKVLTDTTLRFGLPESPVEGCLQLNEVLFNPLSGGCDYVEFVNISNRWVDLSKVWLTNRSKAGTLNQGFKLTEKPLACMPGSYWLLSESSDSVCASGEFPHMENALDMTGFPSFPDDAGTVSLVSSGAIIIDEMSYSEQMHSVLISHPEGVSLEKVHPNLPSATKSSWLSASTSSHYGTPGYKNSQYRETTISSDGGFFAEQPWMTPDGDGRNDRICISYRVMENSIANLALYDLQGRRVKKLVENELLGAEGLFFWDGTTEEGSMAAFGRYLLLAEAFTPSGQLIRKRLVLTILF
jgi:hypothetical protein